MGLEFKDKLLVNHPSFGLAFRQFFFNFFFSKLIGRSYPFEVKKWQYFATKKMLTPMHDEIWTVYYQKIVFCWVPIP
jgi:hypothetical protein